MIKIIDILKYSNSDPNIRNLKLMYVDSDSNPKTLNTQFFSRMSILQDQKFSGLGSMTFLFCLLLLFHPFHCNINQALVPIFSRLFHLIMTHEVVSM